MRYSAGFNLRQVEFQPSNLCELAFMAVPAEAVSNWYRSVELIMNAYAYDLSLVCRAQSGERRAFDLLVRKYRPSILKLALRYTRNRSDADDVAQEAFIRAYGGLRHFRHDSTFYSWLYRITLNTAKNLTISQTRRPRTVQLEMPDPDIPLALKDSDTPEELALTEEIRQTVNAAVAALPEVHRTAILLRKIEGFSYEKIAMTMSIPIGTVRSRVFRARQSIDHRLRRVFDAGLGRHSALRHVHAGV
jgi:RNA polymerase sigma-70 factor, ECF subfamily